MRKKLALVLALLLLLSTTGLYPAAAGEAWVSPTATPMSGFGVHFVDSSTGWAVGGVVAKTIDGGTTWATQMIPPEVLSAVHFVDSTTGWAVGQGGLVIKTSDGVNWVGATSGVPQVWLEDVYFINSSTGWMVGQVGVIFKTTNGGDSWTTLTSGTSENLYGVHFVNSTTGWAVGSNGTILKTINGGDNWTAQTGVTSFLFDVHFLNSSTGWAVGGGGNIVKTTDGGTNWAAQTSGTGLTLYGVHFVNSTTGWAVGQFGTILKTTDGGTNWADQTSPVTSNIFDVHFLNSSTGWAISATDILKYEAFESSSVGVSAEAPAPPVADQLTFSISAQTAPAGGSVTTDAIDFGTLEANTPKAGSQRLTVSTNATAGYSVSAEEDNPLTAGTDTIADTVGDNSLASESATDTWGSNSTFGFGYSLSDVSGTDAAFTSSYKQFADQSSAETAQAVMANTGPVTANQVDVLYKVNIGPSQPQGSYANNLTYIAVGNF